MAFRAALIVVDMQKDFCPPDGSLAVAGARETIPLINSLLASPDFAVKVATQDFHPPDHVSFASNHPGPNNKPFESLIEITNVVANKPEEKMLQRLWPDHCVQGTAGADFVDGLDVDNVDVFVQKGMDSRVEMYSAFSDSFGNLTSGAGGVNLDLAKTLKERGITHVYVVGLAGDFCVKFTALDAAKSGFEVFVIEDAQRCVDPDSWTELRRDFDAHGVKVVRVGSREVEKVLPTLTRSGRREVEKTTGVSAMPPQAVDLAEKYWNVNVPEDQWTETCPDFLLGISENNQAVLSTRDEDYQPRAWTAVRHLISVGRINELCRQPSELRRYMRYTYDLKRKYGSVLSFVQHERLHWQSLAPSGDPPFTNPNDYKILYNDWPYGVEEGITHLVVWTKFPLEDDEATGRLTARAEQEIEDFVVETFCGPGGVPRENLAWLKNWKSLKSIHDLEHFHVMLYNAPEDLLARLTHGDKPTSVATQNGTEIILGAGAVVGVGALALTQMGFSAQDRQFKKTLQYMHDGQDKIAKKMKDAAETIQPGAKK
ncbi:hypothetical protein DV735_g2862, partial [Chaetothyriales sp. CBS 134920]